MADSMTRKDRDARGTGDAGIAAARERLARQQTALLTALVADGPAPPGFDRERLAVQRRALTVKRAEVVAKVAPELPQLVGGEEFFPAFAEYARGRPLTGGHRQDALDFAAWLLAAGRPATARARVELRNWRRARSGPAPLPRGRLRGLLRRAGDLAATVREATVRKAAYRKTADPAAVDREPAGPEPVDAGAESRP